LAGLKSWLEEFGHQVGTTISTENARDMLDQKQYDIVICDSEFPDFVEELLRRPLLNVIVFGDIENKNEGAWYLPLTTVMDELNELIRQIHGQLS